MTKFRTEVHPSLDVPKVAYSSKIFSMGSCFSEEVGRHLIRNKFDCMNNPFGTIFNPLSIEKLLKISLEDHPLTADHYVERDDVWYHLDFHSSIFGFTKEELEEKIKRAAGKVKEHFLASDFLFITLGTSFGFRYQKSGEVVANCHKQKSSDFHKELLEPDQIIDSIKWVQSIAQDKTTVFTVSPVRHIKETLEQNSTSKSILKFAVHKRVTAEEKSHYFPAYEIMMDDLRDYRFYSDDLIHPSAMAVDYIWSKFKSSIFDEKTLATMKRWEGVLKAIEHRPFNSKTEAHQKFIRSNLLKLESFPFSIEKERGILEAQLNS